MRESLRMRLVRWRFNLFPAYRGTGARIDFIADDWSEVRIRLPLSRRTRNYVGTIFGGSMFGAADPVYMLMLIQRLGREYVVWDKAATIRFRRPGRSTLFATFTVSDDEVAAIRERLGRDSAVERVYAVELRDRDGTVVARIEKTIHIRLRASSPAAAER